MGINSGQEDDKELVMFSGWENRLARCITCKFY